MENVYFLFEVFLHVNDKQVSKFHARWNKINKWLDEFPPFKSNQHFLDDQVKGILYSITPKCWKSYLEHEGKFNMIEASADDFFDMMGAMLSACRST
jgi:hypothetical protein